MAKDKRLSEAARSLHRASERLWTRVADAEKYAIAQADVKALQRLTTQVAKAITKLKLKNK